MEMITLAFETGADATTDVSVAYVNSILDRWNAEGIRTPEDVKAMGMDVLRHRVSITYEAEAEELTPEKILQQIFDRVEVP